MTYSLAVILMETSQSLSLFIPIIFTIVISNQVGAYFTRSLYQRACRGKQMPILIDKVPRPCKKIIAEDLMAKNLVTLNCVETIPNIEEAITKTNHHGFPVLNSRGKCIGVIPRNFIIVLLKNNWFYQANKVQRTTVSSMRNTNNVVLSKINQDLFRKYQVQREQTLAR
jgi:predicted transcriptional regulator